MGYNIIVVEDSPTMRQLISFSLRSMPEVSITEAVDGLDGLKKIRNGSFDLAVIDINMPIMDGLKLINQIRNDANIKDLPVVIISTESNEDVKKRAEELKVDAYITKPIMAGHVLKTIRSLLIPG